jgi:hypothetical protein
MTKRTTVTQAQYGRMIKAALAAGLRVAGIKPDGIVTYQDGKNPLAPIDGGSDGVTELDNWLAKKDAG